LVIDYWENEKDSNWMHFAFNFPLEKIIFWHNIIKYDKSWSFFTYNLGQRKW
jgi:hypothetical protein